MTVSKMEYIESARAAGANDFIIIFRHVLVNAMAPIIVQSTLLLGGNVSEEPGTVATELLDSSTGGLTGLLSSSEQAENIPITETQVPTASHFLVFISAFLFLKPYQIKSILKIPRKTSPIWTFETSRVFINTFPFCGRISELGECTML